MSYLGNAPESVFTEMKYQDLTGGSGTSFTLNQAVSNPQEIEVFVTSIRNSAPRHQDQHVLMPGDPERTKRRAARMNGIELGQSICDQLIEISTELSVVIPNSLGD